MAVTALAIAVPAAPRAEHAPQVAALALTNGQRHHYTIGARIRPLLFWIGRDDVGDAVIARKRDGDAASYALLIGSDPARTPRGINRWGYLAEEVRGAEASVVGLMTESNEESVAQAEKNLRADGDRTFNVIRASVVRLDSALGGHVGGRSVDAHTAAGRHRSRTRRQQGRRRQAAELFVFRPAPVPAFSARSQTRCRSRPAAFARPGRCLRPSLSPSSTTARRISCARRIRT